MLRWSLILAPHTRRRRVISVKDAREVVAIEALQHCMVLLPTPATVQLAAYVSANGIRSKASPDRRGWRAIIIGITFTFTIIHARLGDLIAGG